MSAHSQSFLKSFLNTFIITALFFASLAVPPARVQGESAVTTPHDVVLVIDTSNAMTYSLGEIRTAAKAKIDEMAAQTGAWRWTLITFRDTVSLVGTTPDAATAKNWLDVIGADAGGDCPNDSFGALQLAADIAPGGDVWLFTASSPHGGEIALHQTITKLRARNMRVYPLISGWCNVSPYSAQQVRSALAPSAKSSSGSTNANGLVTLPPGIGAMALAGGQFAQPAHQQNTDAAQTTQITAYANKINAVSAADFAVRLSAYGPGWFYPGTSQRYEIAANGNMTVSNVVITLTLPASVTYQSYRVLTAGQPGAGLTPTVAGNLVVWNIGAVQGDWQQRFTVSVTVSANAPTGSVDAIAEIAPSAEDTYPYNNRAVYTHQVAFPAVNAAVEKYMAGQTIPVPGREITYVLNVFNKGNINYDGVLLMTDTLPAHVEFITATVFESSTGAVQTSAFAQNGQTLTWNLTNLPLRFWFSIYPAGSFYYEPIWRAVVRVRISPAAPVSASLVNVLQIGTPLTDTTPADNVFTNTVNVAVPTLDTFVTQQIVNCYPYANGYCSYAPNSEFEYAINFANVGNSPASNVRITDTLPSDLTFITTTRTQGFSVVGNQLRWDIGTLDSSAYNAGYFNVRVRVKKTATPSTVFTNTLQIGQTEADTSPDNNQAMVAVGVLAPVYDVGVLKSLTNYYYCYGFPGSICEFPQGALVEYTLGYFNNGNTIASDVILTDTLPFDGAEFVSTSLLTGMVQVGNQLTWHLGEVPPGSYAPNYNIRVTLRVPTNAVAGTTFTNMAAIGMSEADANPANNTSQVQARAVAPTRDLLILKTICRPDFYDNYYNCDPSQSPSQPVKYVPGDTVKYAITYRNIGNSLASGVRITDTLPFAGATLVTSTRNTSLTVSGSQLIWNVGDVSPSIYYGNPGETFYILLKVPPTTLPGTLFTNTVQVSLNEADILTSNNASIGVGQVVTPMVNLSIQKTASVPKTLPGRRFVYGIAVAHSSDNYTEKSNAHAQDVRITDTLPSGLTALSYSYPQSATLSGNQIVWSLGTLLRGASQALTVSVQTGNVALGTILTNTVQVGASQSEIDPSNNTASANVLVYTPTVALVINKTANTNYALPGQLLTYTLAAYQSTDSYNYGITSEGDATQVVVTDRLPSGLTILGTSWPASVTLNGNQLIWNVGVLEKASTYYCYDYHQCPHAYLEIYGRVNEAPLGTRITNTAFITSSEIPANVNALSSTHSLLVGEADIYQGMAPWERIARETGGHTPTFAAYTVFSYAFDWASELESVIRDMRTTADIYMQMGSVSDNPSACSYYGSNCTVPITHTVNVDISVTQLQILITNLNGIYGGGFATPRLGKLIAPDGSVVLSDTFVSSSVISLTSESAQHYVVNAPAAGQWRLVITGIGSYRLSVSAIASPFGLVSKPALPPNQPSPLKAQGSPSNGTVFSALDSNGTPTATLNLLDDGTHNDGAAKDGVFGGTWTPTRTGSYQLAVIGTDTLNHAPEFSLYQRLDAKPFHVQNLILSGPGNSNAPLGSSGTAVFTLTNYNSTTRTVDLTYSQSQGWATFAGAPARLSVGPGQSQRISIGYSVPATATDFSAAQISLLAQSAYAAEFGDYESAQIVARIYADVAVQGTLPASIKPGQNVTLSIAYSNTGGVTANGLKLTAMLPAGLSYVSDTSGITPTRDGNQMMWTLPALPANGSGGFMLITSAANNLVGTLNIALSISTSTDEINLPNNNAAPVTQVLAPRKLFLPFIRK